MPAIALNQHDTAAVVVNWGQERSELSSEEAEVLSAGCQLYSLSGHTDNTIIIMESVLCVASWQLQGFMGRNPCQAHVKCKLILDYNTWLYKMVQSAINKQAQTEMTN